jgi:carbon monoxide dehydrogenase subunit G
MKTWTTETWLDVMPDEVLAKLTDPESIARWSPVGYELLELDGDRLRAGSQAKVRGALAGWPVEFTVDVHDAADGRLALLARGPVSIAAEYLLHPVGGGSRLQASVSVAGRGVVGGSLARALDGLLAAGMLRVSVRRLARELAAGPAGRGSIVEV